MEGFIALIITVGLILFFFFPRSRGVLGKGLGKVFQGLGSIFLWFLRTLWQGVVVLCRALIFVVPRLVYWLFCVVLEILNVLFRSLKMLWSLMSNSG